MAKLAAHRAAEMVCAIEEALVKQTQKSRVLEKYPNAFCAHDDGLFWVALEKYDTRQIYGTLSARGAWARAWEYVEREILQAAGK